MISLVFPCESDLFFSFFFFLSLFPTSPVWFVIKLVFFNNWPDHAFLFFQCDKIVSFDDRLALDPTIR